MPAPNIRPDAYLSRILDLAIHAQPYWTIKRNFLFAPSFPSIIREFYCFSLQLFGRWPFSWAGGGVGKGSWLAGSGSRKGRNRDEKNLLSRGLNQATFSSLQHLCCCSPENPKIDKIPVNVDIEIGVVQPALDGAWMERERWGAISATAQLFQIYLSFARTEIKLTRQSPKYLKCN